MSKFTIISLLFLLSMGSSIGAQSRDTVGYVIHNDLAYLSVEEMEVDSLQRLNLLLPNTENRPPLLVWVGGGAWSFVNRHQEMALCRKIARKRIAVASVGHRLSKGEFQNAGRTAGVKHPAHVRDLARALKWLVEHADQYGYDGENILVGGFSSGAYLAAILALDEQYLIEVGLSRDHIKAILPIAGAYDIEHYHSVFLNHENPDIRAWAKTHVEDVFGHPEGFKTASPSEYLVNADMPMLIVSDNSLYDYTQVFEDKLREIEYGQAYIYHVFDKDHGDLWRDLSYAEESVTRSLMVQFIHQQAHN